MRSAVTVRAVEPTDLDALVELVLDARSESSVATQICSSDRDALARQVGALTAVPGGIVLVAIDETAVVGLLLGRLVEPNLFVSDTNLHVEAVYVTPSHRRRGVGRALMTEVATLATACGAEHVFAAPIPGARGMQRFLVQLGFAPAGGHRFVTTAALHRRLAGEPAARRGSRLEDLIARRRRQPRSRPEAEAVVPTEPVAEAHPAGGAL